MKTDGGALVGFSGEGSSLPVHVQWDSGNNNINKCTSLRRSLLKLEPKRKERIVNMS